MTPLPMVQVDGLAVAVPAAAWFGVLLVDIDRFSEVNDALGHRSGDELLSQVAMRLEPHDTAFVARMVPDVFVLVLAGDDRDDLATEARNLAAQIVSDVDDVYKLPEPWPVTVTVGVAVGRDVATALGKADERIYIGRSSDVRHACLRRNLVVFEDTRTAVPEGFGDPTAEFQARCIITVLLAAGLRREFGDDTWARALLEMAQRVCDVTGVAAMPGPTYEQLAIRNYSATITYEDEPTMRSSGSEVATRLREALSDPFEALGGVTIGGIDVGLEVSHRADRQQWDKFSDYCGEPRSEPPRFFVRVV